MRPRTLAERLKAHLEFVRLRRERDIENGAGYAPVPTSLEHKWPGSDREFRWQFVFGTAVARLDGVTGRRLGWHAHPGVVDRSKCAWTAGLVDRQVRLRSFRRAAEEPDRSELVDRQRREVLGVRWRRANAGLEEHLEPGDGVQPLNPA